MAGPTKDTRTAPRSCTALVTTPHLTPIFADSDNTGKKTTRRSADQSPNRARDKHSATAKAGNCLLSTKNMSGTMKGASSSLVLRAASAARSRPASSSGTHAVTPAEPANVPNTCTAVAVCSSERPSTENTS